MKNASDFDLTGAIAFSYARFSDPIQEKGHSLERQQEYAPQFCEEFGCKLDATLVFEDRGKSAFHGKHLSAGGGLARFLQCIEAGRVRAGDIIIIENLDRVSRLPLEQAEELLRAILASNVLIHTRSPWAIYDRSTLNDPMARMQMIFEFTRSHRESLYKQERLTRRWIKNRDGIREGNYHLALTPAWIDPVRNKARKVIAYELNRHAETVKLIYEWSVGGLSINAIARRLNDEQIQTMGRSQYWGHSSVAKILVNRAVIGEYQPFSSVKTEGREIFSTKRVAIGEPIKGHYPQAVSYDVFNSVQLALHKRKVVTTGAGTKRVTNLFSGLIRDARDGSPMHVVDKGHGPQLISIASQAGQRERAYIPYGMIESSLIVYAKTLPLSMIAPANQGKLDRQIQAAAKEVESLKLQIDKIKAKTRTSTSDALLELLVERDVEYKLAQQELEVLERQRGSSASVAVQGSKQIIEKLSTVEGDELLQLRDKLRNEIRYWMKQMTVLPLKFGNVKAAMVDIELANGKHFEFKCSEKPLNWPEELDGFNILEFSKWPKHLQRTKWETVLSHETEQILALDSDGKSLAEIAETLGLRASVVSRRLIANGRRRTNRGSLGKDRQMSWNSAANGWQKIHRGQRHYVGCGKLKELYPRLVKTLDREGTLKAANKWWLAKLSEIQG